MHCDVAPRTTSKEYGSGNEKTLKRENEKEKSGEKSEKKKGYAHGRMVSK